MRLLFIDARRVNLGRDGFDFQYFYKVNDDNTIHSIYIVITSNGAELAWNNISEQDLHEYAKRVFALTIDFIKSYWQSYNKLPDEGRKYFENKDLGQLGETKIEWKSYILYLTQFTEKVL